MANEIMALDFGAVAMPFDADQAAELTKTMTAGLGGLFKKSPRLTMNNKGKWELVDENGEIHDLGNSVNFVVVDQRPYNSRIHYEKTFDEQKASGEFEAPDCYSTNGEVPDSSIQSPLCANCKDCAFNKISANYEAGNLACGIYRRVIVVLVNEDGTFSDPCVYEPKYLSISGDKTILKERYGSWAWYMNVLANQTRNGVKMPIPAQAVVTTAMDLSSASVATTKFGVASTKAGGYWALDKEQFNEILRLKDSDEVKEMLEPSHTAFNNPSSAGQIPVVNVEVPETTKEEPKAEVQKAKSAPTKKAPPKKTETATAPKVKKVVLGLNHPDVVNSKEFDYEEIVEWAKDADEADVNDWLADNFPQALEPVEVLDEEAEVQKAKSAPTKKAPPKKTEPKEEKQEANVVDTTGKEVDPELAQKAEELAGSLDDFDD